MFFFMKTPLDLNRFCIYLELDKNVARYDLLILNNYIELIPSLDILLINNMDDGSSNGHQVADYVIFKIHKWNLKLSQLRYFTFLIIGVSLLWPWNCFLSASGYYADRFANSPSLAKTYSSTMMSVSTVTSLLYNYYLSQVQNGVNYKFRVKLGFVLGINTFILMAFSCITNLFVEMNDVLFFIFLMTMVFVSSMATCLAQNGTMALVNLLGGIYANGLMVGQAVAGVLPSIALIISVLALDNGTGPQDTYLGKNYGLFFYYLTASLVAVLSIVLLQLVDSYRSDTAYHPLEEQNLPETESASESSPEEEQEDVKKVHVPFSVLWSKLKLIVTSIFLTFSITLVFPVFASTVESVHSDSNKSIFLKQIFIPLIFFIWNLGDLMGRVLCGLKNSPFLIANPKSLIKLTTLRLLFIPLFFTCNISPSSLAGALINSDIWYVILQFLFGLSNGQLATSSFMIVGDYCDTDEEKAVAGGFTTVFLSVGLAVGSILSYLLVLVI